MAKIETDLQKKLAVKGYKTLKNGWPDLLIVDSKDNVFFIEAKDQGDRLREHQKEMLQTLADLGFTVFIVTKTNQLYEQKKKLHLYNAKGIKETETLNEALRRTKKEIITKTLNQYDNDRIKTSNHLGITLRQLRYALATVI